MYIYIYIYIQHWNWFKDGPVHGHSRHVATSSVVMRKMSACDCLHDFPIYVLHSLLCACRVLCVLQTNFCFN